MRARAKRAKTIAAVVFAGLSLPELAWSQTAAGAPPPAQSNELAQSYFDLLAVATAQWAQARQQLAASQQRIRELESQLAKKAPEAKK